MIRIVAADDHVLIREGVKKIIRSCKDMRMVGEAATLEEAINLITQTAPDLVILDISLPGQDGLAGLTTMRRLFPEVPVLILSMYPEERYAIPALKAGAAGYITKTMAADELVKAIRKIMVGGNYIGPRLAELLAMEIREPQTAPEHSMFTIRESEILSLLAAGKSVKQIAAELSISNSSVNTYRARIFRKTGLRSNAELIRYAVERGMVG